MQPWPRTPVQRFEDYEAAYHCYHPDSPDAVLIARRAELYAHKAMTFADPYPESFLRGQARVWHARILPIAQVA